MNGTVCYLHSDVSVLFLLLKEADFSSQEFCLLLKPSVLVNGVGFTENLCRSAFTYEMYHNAFGFNEGIALILVYKHIVTTPMRFRHH